MDAAMAASEVFLHIDAYKVDQVIRTLLTNAVCLQVALVVSPLPSTRHGRR